MDLLLGRNPKVLTDDSIVLPLHVVCITKAELMIVYYECDRWDPIEAFSRH